MKWTRFWDMSSGGGEKEDYPYILVELPESEADIWFYNRFGHSPERVSCTCCGSDYSIDEFDSLEQATAYDRGCRYDNNKHGYVEEGDPDYSYKGYQTLDEYKTSGKALIVPHSEVKDEELRGDVPEEGYVWVG